MSEIRFFASSYEECKREFILFKNANREFERDEVYFKWRYLNKPAGFKPLIIWAVNGFEEKVGVMSITPHFFHIYDQIHLLGILGDISVGKEWRGRGIAQQMFSYLSEADEVKHFKGFAVIPNEPAAGPLEKAGWKTLSKLERYVKFIDVEEKISGWTHLTILSKLISFPINMLLKLFTYESYLKEKDQYRTQLLSQFDERFDDLWENFDKKGIMIGVRNKEYLNWRFFGHPVVKYHIFTLSDHRKLYGYVVFHFDGRRCQIDDLLFINDGKTSIDLMSCFLRYIRKTKKVSVVSITVSTEYLSSLFLNGFGFFKSPDYLRFMAKLGGDQFDTGLIQSKSRSLLTIGDKEV